VVFRLEASKRNRFELEELESDSVECARDRCFGSAAGAAMVTMPRARDDERSRENEGVLSVPGSMSVPVLIASLSERQVVAGDNINGL